MEQPREILSLIRKKKLYHFFFQYFSHHYIRMKQMRRQNDKSPTRDIINSFRLKKENETIKDKIIRNVKTLFEEQDYH